MLSYSEIKRGKLIVYKDEPYKVMTNNVAKKNRNKPTNQTKLKSLVSGKSIEVTFHASDKIEEANIERNDLKYLYQKGSEVWFCSANNPKDRFNLNISAVEDQVKYLKQNDVIRGMYFKDEIIGLDISPTVVLEVKEAPLAVKGNTATGASKKVILENGLEVLTPLFVNEGDKIIMNTETGKYRERV